MFSSAILTTIVGVSSALGVISLALYFYFLLEYKRAELSVSGLIGSGQLFTAKDVIDILPKFTTDDKRLEALKEVTRYSTENAKALLHKVEAKVDVNRLAEAQTKNYQRRAALTAIFFGVLAALAVVYGLLNKPKSVEPDVPAPQPAASIPASTPTREPRVTTAPRTYRSGNMPSGLGGEFSGIYELCTSDLAANERIISSEFHLVGDRACNAWSTCTKAVDNDQKVCWTFSLQGHNEIAGQGSIRMSEGVLNVQVKRTEP